MHIGPSFDNARRICMIFIGIMMIATYIPIGNAIQDSETVLLSQEPEAVMKGEGFTHSVMLELFVTTWCDRCPKAEEASTELNMEYVDNFHYVNMICDVNDDADQRSEDYLVETYPTAIFDGGYEEDRASEDDSSGQTDKERYEECIESSGNRDVSATPVDLSVDVTDQGNGNVEVSYSATYTGNSQWFDCHIRVYVTEQVSRYDNVDEEPIPYGFLDYAFDEDLRLYNQLEQSDQVTVDTDGGEFDNIIVIAAVFDKRTGVERYVVQTASTEEYGDTIFSDIEHSPSNPKHNQDVQVSCNAVGDIKRIYVEVAACTEDSCLVPEDVDMEYVEGNFYTANIGDFDDDIVRVHYKIIAEDSGGQKSNSTDHEFVFDDSSGDDDGPSYVLMYGGGAVVVLGIALAGLFITRNHAGKKEEEQDQEI